MLFNSKEFILIFFPLVLLGYYLLPKIFKNFSNVYWLLAASIIFYSYWNYKFILLLLLSASVNYSIGSSLKKNKKNNLLILGILFNLFILGYFKYRNFFVENINFLFSQDLSLANLILPLGISFFTFQQIAYLVDMKNQTNISKDNFLKFFLFLSFFPQLIAGPIVKHRNILPQLNSKSILKLNYRNISIGLSIFCIGLFKKTFIADNLGLISDPIFYASENLVSISFFEAWVGTIAYSFQIYFDFSAYSEMAIGLALLFNIKLPFNFTSPYKSKNISIFWRNWHITLSSFLRDYFFFPIKYYLVQLSYSKKNLLVNTDLFSNYFPIILTFLMIGIWHGAGWNFVIFGLLHGLGIIIVEILNKAQISFNKSSKYLSYILTFLFVSLCWVLFRSETIAGALNLYYSLFGLNFFEHESFFPNKLIPTSGKITSLILIGTSIICFLTPNIKEIFFSNKNMSLKIFSWSPNLYWMIYCASLFVVGFLYIDKTIKFLYFAF